MIRHTLRKNVHTKSVTVNFQLPAHPFFMNSRKIKIHTPIRLIVGLGILGVGLVLLISYAVYYSQKQIEDARLRGVVTEKHFTPEPEHQITIGSAGLSQTKKEGEFVLTVEVKLRNGTTKEYSVFVDESRYQATQIGDAFDVGPYLVAPISEPTATSPPKTPQTQ